MSAELNAWIAAVPDGAELDLAAGCFRVDQTIVVEGKKDLVIAGSGATLDGSHPTGDTSPLAAPSKAALTRRHLLVENSEDIAIERVEIVGAMPAADEVGTYVRELEGQHGMSVLGSVRVTLRHSKISRVYGDFVYFGLSDGEFSSGHLHDNTFDRSGRQGIAVTGGRDVIIEGNEIRNTGRSTLDIEPNASHWGGERVVFRDNTVGRGGLGFVAISGGGPVADVEISGNRLVGRPLMVFIAGGEHRPRNIRISGNSADTVWGSSSARAPISVSKADDVRIEHNHGLIQEGRGNAAVIASETNGLVVSGNEFPGAVEVVEQRPGSTNEGLVSCGNRLVAGGQPDRPTNCAP